MAATQEDTAFPTPHGCLLGPVGKVYTRTLKAWYDMKGDGVITEAQGHQARLALSLAIKQTRQHSIGKLASVTTLVAEFATPPHQEYGRTFILDQSNLLDIF